MTLRRLMTWTEAFAIVPEPGYDLVHSLNAVPLLTRRPYLLAFENYLPRVPEDTYIGWLERALQRRLLRDVRRGQCVAILPMSEFARRQFRWQSRNFPEADELERRMQVLYPSASAVERPARDSFHRLKLLFVAARFFGKGGPALLEAHRRLREAGVPVETTIVSTLSWSSDDYVGPPSEAYVRAQLERLTAEEGVVLHRFLPNTRVLELMRESHFFVLPTLHDTFGYTPLEALSQGTPVIATATCAQPEIVEDEKSGYLLPFPNDPHVGKWAWLHRNDDPGYVDAYLEAIDGLSDALVERLARSWETRAGHGDLRLAALERVRTRFSRETARRTLEELYERCRR
jgi:glycosyltransferase involved in cell wall biosynthesis